MPSILHFRDIQISSFGSFCIYDQKFLVWYPIKILNLGKFFCEVLPFHHRRIAYQEATQTFGVITRRIELQDPATGKTYPSHPSASLTASTITYSSAKTGDANMASSSKACDRALMGEVELCSLLIVDQHTFEGEISFASKVGRPQRESDLSLLIFVYALSLKNSPWLILL